ncbi:MAG: cupin domain-containing protein [Deinococcales bacterium]|nr:cupin domain-containing protein [Deinococcales bacterium]
MPILKNGEGQAPAWCEMEYYELVTLEPDTKRDFSRRSPSEKIIVVDGHCEISFGGAVLTGEYGTNVDLKSSDDFFSVATRDVSTTIVWMCGDWESETSSGIFTDSQGDPRDTKGDPVDYPKNTSFDRHYHDCDEYWVIIEGSGVVVSEGKHYEVEPGDCLATGMGFHHDIAISNEPEFKGVWFETGLEGRKRKGHLWEHTHGPAVPQLDRV